MAGFLGEKTESLPHGSMGEMLNIPIGAVVLMDHHKKEKVSLLAMGSFAVQVIVRASFHILACFCSIGAFQWPITKDSVTVRMAKRTFAIAMPGLLYGLQFPKLVPQVLIDNLITILNTFGHYRDLNENQQGYVEDNSPNLWKMMRPKVEAIANEELSRLGQPIGKSRFNMSAENSCVQRAIRMSSVTRLIIDSMVRTGALSIDYLVAFGSDLPHKDQLQGLLFPSVNVFTSIVDSLELLWIVFSSGIPNLEEALDGAVIPLHGTIDDIDFCLWTINEAGLVALLRLIMPSGPRQQSIIAAVESANENENENKDKEKDNGRGVRGFSKSNKLDIDVL